METIEFCRFGETGRRAAGGVKNDFRGHAGALGTAGRLAGTETVLGVWSPER